MNNNRIKTHIPEGEDSFTLPSSDSSVSVKISLLHSLPELSLATLLTAAGFHAYSSDGGTLHIFRWGAGTRAINLNSLSGLPTDFIITSPDKAAVFPSFSNTTAFIASSVPYPSHDTFYLAYSAARFDTCGKKGGINNNKE